LNVFVICLHTVLMVRQDSGHTVLLTAVRSDILYSTYTQNSEA